MDRIATSDGRTVTVRLPGRHIEQLECQTAEEAQARAAFVSEAYTWVGTPFVDCADVKGPKGAVDCAMMLVRSAVDSGLIEPFDPRPYAPRHMLHRSEELFLGVLERLGAFEVSEPVIGDIIVWQFGRVFSHGAVLVMRDTVVHAYASDGFCTLTGRYVPLLTHIGVGMGVDVPRPVRYYSLWGKK